MKSLLIALLMLGAASTAYGQNTVKPIVLPQTVLPYQYRITNDGIRLNAREIDAIALRVVQYLQAAESGQALSLSDPDTAAVQTAINQSCLKCHTGEDADGGVDLSNLAALSNEQARAVTAQVFDGLMPKNADPLPDDTVAAFVRWQLRRSKE